MYGADVLNAFAEAPPPKQGFYIRWDRAFLEWWASKTNGRKPIPPCYVIPLMSAIQGHPESPHLWERLIDKHLQDIGLTPTVQEPCLYSGLIDGHCVLFMRQMDDFAVAAPSEQIANHVFDMLDDRLTFPMKRMGLISLFNELDITQTVDFVKIWCSTYLDKVLQKHLSMWLSDHDLPSQPTPLPTTKTFLTSFLNAKGDPDPKAQAQLAQSMKLSYQSAIWELIWAMTTCRPDISYATVRTSKYSCMPYALHYHGINHILKYLHATKDDGIFFWRTTSNEYLPAVSLPTIHSNVHNLLLDGRPSHEPLELHGFVYSYWAARPQTHRSFTGTCLCLAGGCVAYKTQLLPTVALSSTEVVYMGACNSGKMILFVRSILWDLGVPQLAASILYKDNDACIAIANAQEPTTRTRYMDIKYHFLCEWVEHDLLIFSWVDTLVKMLDHFTNQLGPTLFHCHVDYIMGWIPPHYTQWFRKLFGSTSWAVLDRTVPKYLQPVVYAHWLPVLTSVF